MKVQFFWPFKGDYWIIDLADDYSWAVVSDPKQKMLWIHSRTSKMDEVLYNSLIEKLVKIGFDKEKIVEWFRNSYRLDALGAIGIARTFNYDGFRNREIYNPNIKPDLNMTKEEYKNSTAPTLNHFYEKLLLLKGRMNTSTGQQMAEKRQQFMEKYLEEFYEEWEGGTVKIFPLSFLECRFN